MSIAPLTDNQRQQVTANYGWVKEYVIRIRRRYPYFSHGELLSWAGDGLMNSVRLYDSTVQKTTFEAYTKHKIHYAIASGMRETYLDSQSRYRRTSKIDRVMEQLSIDLGRTPTVDELSKYIPDVSTDYVRQYQQGLFADIDVEADDNIATGGVEWSTPESLLINKQDVADLNQKLYGAMAKAQLDDVERRLVLGEVKHRDIADKKGVSESRVSQLYRFALFRLKQVLLGNDSVTSRGYQPEKLVTLICWPIAQQFDECRHELSLAMRALGEHYLAGGVITELLSGRQSYYGQPIEEIKANWQALNVKLYCRLYRDAELSDRDPDNIKYRRKCRRRLLRQLTSNGYKQLDNKRRFWRVYGRGMSRSAAGRIDHPRKACSASGVTQACNTVVWHLLMPVWRQGLRKSTGTDERILECIDRYIDDPLAVRVKHPYLNTPLHLVVIGLLDQGDSREMISYKLGVELSVVIGNIGYINKNRRLWLQSLDQRS